VAEPYAGLMVTPSVRLERLLGEGGMGSVWLADHTTLHTRVVVKFISADHITNSEALTRFSREAAAASQVKSPHVVQTLDHGVTPDNLPYIVMEHLEGQDLEHHLGEHRMMRAKEVLELVGQLCKALEKAHAAGIVHRDIKPSNIFLCDAGDGGLFVKLLDFGIAKGGKLPTLDSGTKTGSMMGSPYYMSPEQVVGSKEVDFRSDLWSVGVVAFECLCGRRPFEAETLGGLAIKIHTEDLPRASSLNPALTPAIDAWFDRACARAPEARFASARELSEQLAAAIGGDSRTVISLVPAPSSNTGHDEAFARTAPLDNQSAAVTGARTQARRTLRGVGIGVGVMVAGFGLAFGVITATRTPGNATGLVMSAEPRPSAAASIQATATPSATPVASATASGPVPTSHPTQALPVVPSAKGPKPAASGKKDPLPVPGTAAASNQVPPVGKNNDIY
jgi:eukaryotic-like serine/threonine-protein kinase